MVQVLPVLAALLGGVGFLVVGNGLLTTLLSVRMGIEEIPSITIGLILSAYSIGFVVGTLTCHRLINQIGHIRAFAALAALASVTVLMHPLIISPLAWGGLRILTGFCLAGLFTISEAWLNARVTSEYRGRILSIYMVVNFSALTLGQLLLKLGDPSAFELFSIVAILYALSLVPVTLTRIGAPAIEASEKVGITRLFSISPLGVVVCFGAGLVNAAFFGMGPVFAQELGMEIDSVATFMAVAIFSGLLLQWPVGWLSDYFDRRHVMLWMCAGVSLSAIGVGFAHQYPNAVLLSLVAVYGGLAFTLYGQAVSHANDYADPSQLVSVSAGLLLAYGIGAILGPILASSTMLVMGPQGLFIFIGAAAAAQAAFIVYRMVRRDPLPIDEQSPFSPVLATTPVAAELDPRGEQEGADEITLDGDDDMNGGTTADDWGRARAAALPWPVR
jgi:MFS family permease